MIGAHQAQIVKSHRKDEHYRNHLKSLFTSCVNYLPGVKTWLKYTKELEVAVDVLYFGLTTFAGYQTLGEEYVNILPINKNKKSIPSKYRRALLIIAEVFLPYALDRFAALLVQHLKKGGQFFGAEKQNLASFVDLTRNIANFFYKYHLALFYVSGTFYHIARRLLGIYYVQVRPTQVQQTRGYKILGLLMITQLVAALMQRFHKLWVYIQQNEKDKSNALQLFKVFISDPTETETDDVGDVDGSENQKLITNNETSQSVARRKCSLCHEFMRGVTSTSCGHLFCWKCILDWCKTKKECPVCRDQIVVSKLICLQNYV